MALRFVELAMSWRKGRRQNICMIDTTDSSSAVQRKAKVTDSLLSDN